MECISKEDVHKAWNEATTALPSPNEPKVTVNPTVGSTSVSIPNTDRQMRMLRHLGNDQAITPASVPNATFTLPASFKSSGTEMAEAQYGVWEIFAKKL